MDEEVGRRHGETAASHACGVVQAFNRETTGAIVGRQPSGGFKMSGVGAKAGGPDYLLQFLDARVVTENTMGRGFVPFEELRSAGGTMHGQSEGGMRSGRDIRWTSRTPVRVRVRPMSDNRFDNSNSVR